LTDNTRLAALTVTKPLQQIATVKDLLSSQAAYKQLGAVASRTLDPATMMRVVAGAIRNTPTLQKADPLSFLGAMMTSSQLGFIPNTPLGHSYLVPFWSSRKNCYEVQLIIGYKGFIDLAYRSGKVISVAARTVYEGDEFDYSYGSKQGIHHRRGKREEGEKQTYAYCYAQLVMGDSERVGETFEVLPWADILRTRGKSQGWLQAVKTGKEAAHPWHESQHIDVMGAKTAVRYTANRGMLPMSIEYLQASAVDDKLIDYGDFALGAEDAPVEAQVEESQTPGDAEPAKIEAPTEDAKPKRKYTRRQDATAAPQSEPETAAEPSDGVRGAEEDKAAPEPAESVYGVVRHTLDMLVTDIGGAKDLGEFEALLQFYADRIDEVQRTSLAQELREHIEATRVKLENEERERE
jgi:recombination protein RecT